MKTRFKMIEEKLTNELAEIAIAGQGLLPTWLIPRIALFFGVHPTTIWRKIGALPPGPDHVTFKDWTHLLSQLPPEEQEELRKKIEDRISKRQNKMLSPAEELEFLESKVVEDLAYLADPTYDPDDDAEFDQIMREGIVSAKTRIAEIREMNGYES